MNKYRVALMWLLSAMALTACSGTDVAQTSAAPPITQVTNSSTAAPAPVQTVNSGQSVNSGESVRAYIDPGSGELHDPTAEELAAGSKLKDKKALSTAASSTKPAAREVIHPGGIVEVLAEGSGDESKQQALQACIQKDGSLKMGHACAAHSKEKAQ